MNSITILRLYFPASATIAEKQWWRKMMSRNLGHYLLQQAKEAGFHQAILYPIAAGFLKGDPVSWNLSDIPPAKLPQCLEIIGDEELLNAFLTVERPHLANARVVLLRSTDAIIRDSDAISDVAD